MTEVFPYLPSMGLKHALVREMQTNPFVGGYSELGSAETAFERANGTKGVENYKGLNAFSLTFNSAMKGSGKLADQLWQFFLDRLDAHNEPFYFYNPTERWTPDLTAVDSIGRYLVRLRDPNQALTREYFRNCLFSYGLEFIECRDFAPEAVIELSPIIWHSCPSDIVLVDGEVWYITTLSSGYDEYNLKTQNSQDALYILKYNFDTEEWTQIYLEEVFDESGTMFTEPEILTLLSSTNQVYLTLESMWDNHASIRVFNSDGELIDSYEPTYYPVVEGTRAPAELDADGGLLDSSDNLHILTEENLGGGVKKIYDRVYDSALTGWTEYLIHTFNIPTYTYVYGGHMTQIGGVLYAMLYSARSSSPYTAYLITYKSIDQGLNWTSVSSTDITGYYGNGDYYMYVGEDGTNLYVVTYESLGRGARVWRSTDQGATWNPTTLLATTSNGYTHELAGAAFFHASNALYIFVVYDRVSGFVQVDSFIKLYKSTDNGVSWTYVSDVIHTLDFNAQITFKVLETAEGRLIFSGYYISYTDIYGYQRLGFLYSDDEGETWTWVRTPFYDVTAGGRYPVEWTSDRWHELLPTGSPSATWLACLPLGQSFSDDSLLAVGTSGRVYKKPDGSDVWSEFGPLQGADQYWICADAMPSSRIMLTVYGGRIWYTTNGGTNWSEFQPAGNVDKNWMFARYGNDYTYPIAGVSNGRLYISNNAGVGWSEVQPAGDTDVMWKDAWRASAGVYIIAAASPGRLYISTNSGTNWTERQPAGDADKTWAFVHVLTVSGIGVVWVAAVYGGGLYLSFDNGVTWTQQTVTDIPATDNAYPWWTTSRHNIGAGELTVAGSPGRIWMAKRIPRFWYDSIPADLYDLEWEEIRPIDDNDHDWGFVSIYRTLGIDTKITACTITAGPIYYWSTPLSGA